MSSYLEPRSWKETFFILPQSKNSLIACAVLLQVIPPLFASTLQRFIGLANFYRRFINHFSGTARPLHNLTRAKSVFIWNQRCDKAFGALKTAFTTAPVLKFANPYQQFILECDCSNFALGAVLSQVCKKDGKLHPVA
ncbi:hypothetical protein PCANC_00563 [Puccinia coronata f. sp. avenae]|uniref:Reverse transcriptase/retrotransposon-derived protein RNase H-like domain-containing protein n=1 Tax=Puccinia coronata f. sp. avenae TaxID=200324 RepID=A0A2N5W843_9BASI|nr:hypothetical protein PCANC_00563 [Puccinia coronata f. sp. avenae]